MPLERYRGIRPTMLCVFCVYGMLKSGQYAVRWRCIVGNLRLLQSSLTRCAVVLCLVECANRALMPPPPLHQALQHDSAYEDALYLQAKIALETSQGSEGRVSE